MSQESKTSTHDQLQSGISPISDINTELRESRMGILVDERAREDEGEFMMAAEFVTPEDVNFLVTHGRGLECLTLTEDRCQQIGCPLSATRNGTRFGTNLTVSIEAADGVDTGISAAGRARTVQAAVARDAKPSDLVQPVHIFPLKAARGGVLVRAGHTEAGCDLTTLAGVAPAAVICEILNPDGTMARLPDLIKFADTHGLKIGTIADLIQYRSTHESMIERLFERETITPWGRFKTIGYRDLSSGAPHVALVHGDIQPDRETLVRVHEPTTVLDLLCAESQDHSWSIPAALNVISQSEAGVCILMNCQGDQDKVFEQFDLRRDTESTASGTEQTAADKDSAPYRYDLRTYGIGAQILRDLNVGQARLLARPRKMPSMAGFALTITGYLSEDDITT